MDDNQGLIALITGVILAVVKLISKLSDRKKKTKDD